MSGPGPSTPAGCSPWPPLVLVATTLVVAAVAPLLATDPAFGWSADLFAVVFLLLLGSVSLALGALDTGTAFGGMGASRAMTIGALAEPALLVAILALSVPAHSSNLPAIITRSLAHPAWLATPERVLALVAFVIVIVAESGRLPVDNPTTHLELTMIHEAMVLEYAGPDLALVKLAESMRLAVLLALLAELFLPWGIATAPGPGHLALALASTAEGGRARDALAAFEVAVAKLRLFRVPELLAGAFVLAGAGRPLRAGGAVSGPSYASALTLASGAVLVCAVAVLWLASIRAVVRVVAVQGVALGAGRRRPRRARSRRRPAGRGGRRRGGQGGGDPVLLGQAERTDAGSRESRPLVNVPASLVASAALIVLAFVTGRGVAHFVGTPGRWSRWVSPPC